MKRIIVILILALILPVSAEEVKPEVQNSLVIPQNINFGQCTKIFKISQEKLFYLTLASISANRFGIDEIQTSDGYIIFSVNKNKYLASVAKVDSANSILKITPCNNVYNFPYGIITNIFKYIELEIK